MDILFNVFFYALILFVFTMPLVTLEAVKIDSKYIYIYRMRRLRKKLSLSAVKAIRKSNLWEIFSHRSSYPFFSITIEYWDREIEYIHPYNYPILLSLKKKGKFFG